MAWNHPDDNGHDRDPWGSNNNNNNNSSGSNNKGRRAQKPSNLEDIFHKFSHKINSFNNKNYGISTPSPGRRSRYIGLAIAVAVIMWIGNGFYIIKEAKRGVVLRFGKFNHLVQPGLNWKLTFIDTVITVNVGSVRELVASGLLLTSDENVVRVEMNVQYNVTNPECYLFSVTNADDSLRQATYSALRDVIGRYTMDRILSEGYTIIRQDTQRVLEEIIQPYNMGITLLDVNFQIAQPPEEVKTAFDDAIIAQKNEQQYIREAEAYSNEVRPQANCQAQHILEDGRAYKLRTVLEAQGEIQRINKILPEYKAAPVITRERLYIDTMEHILSNTYKILINDKISNNLLILPLDHMLNNVLPNNTRVRTDIDNTSLLLQSPTSNPSQVTLMSTTNSSTSNTVTDQRRINTQRDATKREGR